MMEDLFGEMFGQMLTDLVEIACDVTEKAYEETVVADVTDSYKEE